MVDGGINKFLAENTPHGATLREGRQADGREDACREEDEAQRLSRLVVGEGIEKKQSDFAAEVAAMTKSAA
jgi:elongation factor Ts